MLSVSTFDTIQLKSLEHTLRVGLLVGTASRFDDFCVVSADVYDDGVTAVFLVLGTLVVEAWFSCELGGSTGSLLGTGVI